MKIFYYQSPIGIFWIKPQPGCRGRWWLGFDDEALGSYATPALAAGDVYSHVTGHMEWDMLDGKIMDVPESILEWQKGNPDYL